MLADLYKNCHVSGPSGMWGTFNNARELASSPDGYLLAIAKENIAQLDDFTVYEEGIFWDFMFSKAADGIGAIENRGVPGEGTEPLNTVLTPCSTLCAVNDGTAAWQSVGTTHGHIIWLADERAVDDMQSKLAYDRAFFSKTAGSYTPLASTEVILTPNNSGQDIRAARQNLKSQFNEATSFSIYTKQSSKMDPRAAGISMIIEAWSDRHHSVASLSGFFRYWNGLTQTPVSTNNMGLQRASFRRNP